MDRIAQKIAMESRDCSRNGSVYQTKINMDIALQPVSPTLLTLLTKVSGKLGSTAQGAMIGNIITNVISNKPTPLQVALSVLLSKKALIEELHYFRICCSYDEYLRFKASAAKAAEAQTDLRGLLSAKEGIIQVVAHNFDSNISSQNGLLSTHKLRLALLLTLREEKKSLEAEEGATNRRVSRDEARHQITHEVSAEIPRTQKASSACHRSKACCSAPESTG